MSSAGLNTATTPVLLSKNTQAGLLAYQRECYQQHNSQWNLREQMRDIDLSYAREMDLTVEHQRAKIANRYGDKDRFQNITIPVVMPQVEAAVTYQSSVFLTGIPLFGVSAAPQWENEALMMETVIDNQATRGGWSRELALFFRDGFKYNISALECSWCREVTWAPETDISFDARIAKPKEVIWEGNKLRRWDMYNTFFDNRVAPAEMHTKGDFVGNTEVMSRIRLKQFIQSLPDVRVENIKEAFESGIGSISISTGGAGGIESYYVPQINPRALITPGLQGAFNWASWAGISGAKVGIEYKNMYEVTTMYARIMPADFNMKLPEQNTPQIWKLIFVNHQVLIYAERQTNAHNMLPVLFGQPLEDGLGYQTKSLADNVGPIQDITSALSNSAIAARRRAISDRTLYDPSRVTEAHINNANPAAKIPVRPGAYGKPVSDAVYAFPFRDDQAPYISAMIQQYGSMANMISGQNPVRQGQFVKGNKTTSEFDTVMGNANGRDQLIAMGYESQIFTPLKEILKINILQYQGGISLYSREKKTNVKIDPVELRKAVMQFKISDGLTPTDKLMDSDMLAVALQQIGSAPVISAGYNVAPMFSYLMKLKGADLTPFEKSPQQQAYEQAMGQYQQMVMQLYKQNPDQDAAKLPPAPLPQQFGYDPAKQAGMPATQEASQPGQPNQQPQPNQSNQSTE